MWQQLPTDLLREVWRSYFTAHVLPHVCASDRMLACRSISCTYKMDPMLRQFLEDQMHAPSREFLEDQMHAPSRENASRCICRCAPDVVTFLYYENSIYHPLDRGCTARELCDLDSEDSDLEEILWQMELHYDPDPQQTFTLWRHQHAEVHYDVEGYYGNRAEQDVKIRRLQHCGCAEGSMCLLLVDYLRFEFASWKQEDASPEWNWKELV